MIPGIHVQKRQTLTPRSRIDNLVDAGERKMIFRTCPIDMLEVNAHAKGISLLRDHDNISEPLRVVNLSDELSC